MSKTIISQQIEISKTPSICLQERDKNILSTIYIYGGVVAKRHLKALFWPTSTKRAMEMRLSSLYQHQYLNWPNRNDRQNQVIPEPICWLGHRGILWLAHNQGIEISLQQQVSEAKLRVLERQLRLNGIRWVRTPAWSLLKHDLVAIDVRVAVNKAVEAVPGLSLETWVCEREFRLQMDKIISQEQGVDSSTKKATKGICPDGYFALRDANRQQNGRPALARFLLEVDLATHDTLSFVREKVIPGVSYIKSAAYKSRFGANAGRWLVVTTSETRLKHLMAQTQKMAGHDTNIFLFTVFNEAIHHNILTASIWKQIGKKEYIALFTSI